MTKIGITERGDASIDYSWTGKLEDVDGAILITKHVTDKFIDMVMASYEHYKNIIVHATCTGWGGTVMEPNVPDYRVQLSQLAKLIYRGFPKKNCVLRIDPIIPNSEGIWYRANLVIEGALCKGLLTYPKMRVRVSVLDEYKHVKKRFADAGIESPIYPGFQASSDQFGHVKSLLESYGVTFYTCAEPLLNGRNIVHEGCVSQTDLDIFGIKDAAASVNPQNRNGCLCLDFKKELLGRRGQCPHGCLYCYWK